MATINQDPSENSDQEKIDKGGGASSSVEKPEVLEQTKEAVETKADDQKAHQKIRQELESMDLEDSLKAHAQQSANDIKLLIDKKKLEHLLEIAKTKGVIFAINVAKKMNDPYVLDMLHDALARNGYYKDFLK